MYLSSTFAVWLIAQSALAATIPASPNSDFVGELIGIRSSGNTSAADHPPKCSKSTHGTCVYHEKGNTKVGFMDHTINWGTVSPASMVKAAAQQCKPGTLQCGGDPISMKTQVVRNKYGPVMDGKITCHYTGGYEAKYVSQLIDGLTDAVHKTTDTYTVADDPENYVQHRHSPNFYIRTPPKGGSASVILIECNLDIYKDPKGGLCSTFFSIAGTVAGAVEGAGGLLSLFGLLCNPQS